MAEEVWRQKEWISCIKEMETELYLVFWILFHKNAKENVMLKIDYIVTIFGAWLYSYQDEHVMRSWNSCL